MIGREDQAQPGITPGQERAGWYADPFGRADERRWDGRRWTAETRGHSRGGEAERASEPAAEPTVSSPAVVGEPVAPVPPAAAHPGMAMPSSPTAASSPAAPPRPAAGQIPLAQEGSPSRWLVGGMGQPATSHEPAPARPRASEPAAARAPAGEMMSLDEFTREGYLQELNRRFLHPLGLELELERASESIEEVLFAPGAAEQLLVLLDRLVDTGRCSPGEVAAWRSALQSARLVGEGQALRAGVRDLRATPEGGHFQPGNGAERRWRRENIERLWAQRRAEREARFGGMLQDL